MPLQKTDGDLKNSGYDLYFMINVAPFASYKFSKIWSRFNWIANISIDQKDI